MPPAASHDAMTDHATCTLVEDQVTGPDGRGGDASGEDA